MSALTGWTAQDDQAVAYARALAADAVQKVGNGHPGTAMSLAPVAYNLFQRHLVHDPSDAQWRNEYLRLRPSVRVQNLWFLSSCFLLKATPKMS